MKQFVIITAETPEPQDGAQHVILTQVIATCRKSFDPPGIADAFMLCITPPTENYS